VHVASSWFATTRADQAVMTVNWPGIEKVMTPPYAQFAMHELLTAGLPPIITVGEPGDQGAGTTGMHGIGVRTPKAAAVAAATWGFAIDIHTPKGAMFIMGTLSMMLAAKTPPAWVMLTGRTVNVLGAAPKVHIIMAPLTICTPTSTPIPSSNFSVFCAVVFY
jgi:hypothetical protein